MTDHMLNRSIGISIICIDVARRGTLLLLVKPSIFIVSVQSLIPFLIPIYVIVVEGLQMQMLFLKYLP